MTPKELDHFRERLLQLGRHFKGQVTDLESEGLRKIGGPDSGNLSNTPMHLADLGSDAYEQEVALSLLETEEQRLEEIAAALRRLDDGTFGKCETCGRPIAKERLEALPFTSYCIDCARQQDVAPPGNL